MDNSSQLVANPQSFTGQNRRRTSADRRTSKWKTVFLVIFASALLLGIIYQAITPATTVEKISPTVEEIQPDIADKTTAPTAIAAGDPSFSEIGSIRQTYRPEIELLLQTLKIMKSSAKSRLSLSDYPAGFFEELKNKAEDYNRHYVLPPEIESLFVGDQAYREIKSIVYTAREEYLDILEQSGANPALLTEMKETVFPANDNHLWVSNSDDLYSEYSFVRTTASAANSHPAYGESYMRFEMASALQWSRLIHESGILGPEPAGASEKYRYWRNVREYGTREVFYHEMSHVLQQAYINLQVKKYGNTYAHRPETEKSMFGLTDPSILMDTTRTPFSEMDNLTISKESQAMALERYFMVKRFNLNHEQSERIWDYVGAGKRFGWLRKNVGEIIALSTVKNADEKEMEKLKNLSETYDSITSEFADPRLKAFVEKITLLAGVQDTAYAIGYTVDYTDEATSRILSGLHKKAN